MKLTEITSLPIVQIIPELQHILEQQSSAVLVAEPGAGKTTVVPLALMDADWLAGRKIIMLEPRRLAARSAAARLAASLGEQTGEKVGYRVRMDTKVSSRTRIEVVTEGVLTRMLQQDPALEEVGLLIFDEFHERNIHGDLGLALALQARELFRPDLRVIVMSATLDTSGVSELLQQAPVLHCSGRTYPVETIYSPRPAMAALEGFVAGKIEQALRMHEGDMLVFLPGAREIHRTAQELMKQQLPVGTQVHKLYGSLSLQDQDAAVRPAPVGQRKVVLATSIAESSLTIAGITIVMDAGLSRESLYSHHTGMSRLITVRVSKASADQRRGRAGRLGPGVCYRLWSEEEHRALAEERKPEILAADLTSLALELAVWGVDSPTELRWLDAPPPAAFQQSRELLAQLGCLKEGAITAHGQTIADMGTHPRLGHMLIRSVTYGLTEEAALIAALLQERDPLIRAGVDLRDRLQMLQLPKRNGTGQTDVAGYREVDRELVERIRMSGRQLLSTLASVALPAARKPELTGNLSNAQDLFKADSLSKDKSLSEPCGLLLSYAYPDRIGQARGSGRFLLSNGRGVRIVKEELLSRASYIVVAAADDQGADGTIQWAAPVEEQELTDLRDELVTVQANVYWDADRKQVRARQQTRLGAIILQDQPLANPPQEEIAAALMDGIRQQGLSILNWSKRARQLQLRLQLLHEQDESWPDVREEALLQHLEDWLLPYAAQASRLDDLKRLNPAELLTGMLSWEQQRLLDNEAPTHVRVPSGSRVPLDYSNPSAPALHVRLQEVFGLVDTPRIAFGRVPVVLHLLSPAQRPVQVTTDLASFWRQAYFEVKKDLKGRYPKHYWPDNPLEAEPTSRAKPRQAPKA